MTKEQEIILKINEMNFLLTGEAKEKYSPVLKEVLNILKEKDAEIEKLKKEDIRLQEELNAENKRCMILANNDKFKDKIIDLMARAIDNYDSQLEINTFRDKEHVKQYFKEIAERKSKE